MMRHPGMNPELDEMKHAGQQSAAGEIAGRAHQNHDLRKPRTNTLRYPCHVNVLCSSSAQPIHSHVAQGVGDGSNCLPQAACADRADAADPERIDGRELTRV